MYKFIQHSSLKPLYQVKKDHVHIFIFNYSLMSIPSKVLPFNNTDTLNSKATACLRKTGGMVMFQIRFPSSVLLSFGKRKNSQGTMSTKQNGYGITMLLCFAKFSLIVSFDSPFSLCLILQNRKILRISTMKYTFACDQGKLKKSFEYLQLKLIGSTWVRATLSRQDETLMHGQYLGITVMSGLHGYSNNQRRVTSRYNNMVN